LTISINNESAESSLPLKLKKEDNVILSVLPASTTASNFSFVATTVFFEFTVEGENESQANSAYLIFDPIYTLGADDSADLEAWMDNFIP
jgi:hypothetical protein